MCGILRRRRLLLQYRLYRFSYSTGDWNVLPVAIIPVTQANSRGSFAEAGRRGQDAQRSGHATSVRGGNSRISCVAGADRTVPSDDLDQGRRYRTPLRAHPTSEVTTLIARGISGAWSPVPGLRCLTPPSAGLRCLAPPSPAPPVGSPVPGTPVVAPPVAPPSRGISDESPMPSPVPGTPVVAPPVAPPSRGISDESPMPSPVPGTPVPGTPVRHPRPSGTPVPAAPSRHPRCVVLGTPGTAPSGHVTLSLPAGGFEHRKAVQEDRCWRGMAAQTGCHRFEAVDGKPSQSSRILYSSTDSPQIRIRSCLFASDRLFP